MADLDDIRDGREYGVGVAQRTDGFFLKGSNNLDWGMKDRLSRIFNPATGRTVMLAFDHGFIMGPTSGVERIDLSIVPLIEHADCLMCARGVLRALVPPTCRKPVCLRSDAGTSILTELNHNVVIDIQDAVKLNASAIAVMVSVGDAATEAEIVASFMFDENQQPTAILGVSRDITARQLAETQLRNANERLQQQLDLI